jgi:hypothetical protein
VTAPLQYGTLPAPDPTAVMGRRTLAWIADLLLYAGVVALGFASMAEYTDVPPGIADEDACELLETQTGTLEGGCLAMDGTVYLLDTGEAGVQTLISVGWLAMFVILQGVTGGSPGKLLLGVRVVDKHGQRCGIGRSFARTLLWAIDAAPWFIPLVGPITAFTSNGHRRVGDLAAGTYVVSASSVGSPVVPGVAAAPADQPPWGAPPPGWGPPPSAPPSAAAPVAPPATRPGVAEPSGSSTSPDAGPASRSWTPPDGPFVAPGADAPPSSAAAPEQPRDELPPPQWNPARGTYLQWEPTRQSWLQWDAAAQRWKPIDT